MVIAKLAKSNKHFQSESKKLKIALVSIYKFEVVTSVTWCICCYVLSYEVVALKKNGGVVVMF